MAELGRLEASLDMSVTVWQCMFPRISRFHVFLTKSHAWQMESDTVAAPC